MKYKGISTKANKYILIINLIIAFLINTIFIVGIVFLQNYIKVKYNLIFDCAVILGIIFTYLIALFRANNIINNYKYSVSDNKIEVIEGMIIKTKKIMKISKVFKLEIKRNMIGKFFKVACIKFYSNGGSIKINYIGYEEAENIIKEMRLGCYG